MARKVLAKLIERKKEEYEFKGVYFCHAPDPCERAIPVMDMASAEITASLDDDF